MTVNYDEELILGYVEGELTTDQETAFRRMLAQDPRLRQLVDGLASDREQLRKLPPDPSPDDLFERVTAVMERDMLLEPTHTQRVAVRSMRSHHNRRLLAYGSLAAMLLLSALLVVYTLTDDQLSSHLALNPQEPAPPGSVVPMESFGQADGTTRLAPSTPTLLDPIDVLALAPGDQAEEGKATLPAVTTDKRTDRNKTDSSSNGSRGVEPNARSRETATGDDESWATTTGEARGNLAKRQQKLEHDGSKYDDTSTAPPITALNPAKQTGPQDVLNGKKSRTDSDSTEHLPSAHYTPIPTPTGHDPRPFRPHG